MKPFLVALTALVAVTGTIALLALAAFFLGGPAIVIHSEAEGVVLENVFLGEYSLGFTRVTITQESRRLYEVTCEEGVVKRLRLSHEGVELAPSSRCRPVVHSSWENLDLEKGLSLRLCGNNGSGRATCRARSLRLAAAL